MGSPPEKEESGPPIGAGSWEQSRTGGRYRQAIRKMNLRNSKMSVLRIKKAEAQSTNGLTFEATDWGREVSMCSEPVFKSPQLTPVLRVLLKANPKVLPHRCLPSVMSFGDRSLPIPTNGLNGPSCPWLAWAQSTAYTPEPSRLHPKHSPQRASCPEMELV